MAVSNKVNIIGNQNLYIEVGNDFTDSFYTNFQNNIQNYINSSNQSPIASQNLVGQTSNLFTQVFGPSLSPTDLSTLNAYAINFGLDDSSLQNFNSPIVAWYLSNLDDNSLVNLLTTGVLSANTPTAAQQAQIASTATNIDSDLVNDYTQSMLFLRKNQFCCTFSYQGYANNAQFTLDFSQTVAPNSIGACLGLVALIDNNSINPSDANILLNLIKSYSNVTLSISTNLFAGTILPTAQNNFNLFMTQFQNAVTTFAAQIQTNAQNRSGATNAPTPSGTRPTITDNVIILNNNNLINPENVGPSGITLNTFTQPAFGSILSILDIIRDDNRNNLIVPSGNPITANGGDGSGNVQPNTTASIFGNSILTPKVYQISDIKNIIVSGNALSTATTALMSGISANNVSLSTIQTQVNSVLKSKEFILTCFISNIAHAGDESMSPNPEKLTTYYSKLAQGLTGVSGTSDKSPSVSTLINKQSNYQYVQYLNATFLASLGIYPPTTTGIPQAVNVSVFSSTQNNPPADWQTIVALTNKSNSQDVNKKIYSICQSVTSKVLSIEGQRNNLKNQNSNYQRILQELNGGS